MEDILKAQGYRTSLDDVTLCDAAETLASALARARSTHEAVFVMDGKEKFLGVITPFHAVFAKRHPDNTRVVHCLVHVPRLTAQTPLSEVAQAMLDTRAYTLPMFNDRGNVVAAVTAQRILEGVARVPELRALVAERLPVRPVLTLPAGATVQKVYAALRGTNQTRVVLVDAAGKVAGIITRRDLRQAMSQLAPKEGFAMEVHGLFLENEPRERKRPAMDFATHQVITARPSEKRAEILRRMADQKVSSVVVVNADLKPVGIVSARSVLQVLATVRHEPQVPIVWHHQLHHAAGAFMVERVTDLLEKFGKKLHRRSPVQTVDIYLERIKDAAGRSRAYGVSLSVRFWSGVSYLAKSESFLASAKHLGLETAVHRAMKEILAQVQRDHQRTHRHAPRR